MYGAGQKGVYFRLSVFWKWIVLAFWHGTIIYFGTVFVSRFSQ